jgi:uncharacterized protein
MRFEWDEAKNRANLDKHGISFENAQRVFDDPLHRSMLQGFADGEERWETIGMIRELLLVVVISTPRAEGDEEITRLISARRATKRERQSYAKEVG